AVDRDALGRLKPHRDTTQRKDSIPLAGGGVEDFECSWRERDSMFSVTLSPFRWNGPDPRLEVDFWPEGAQHFAPASRCQNRKFEGPGCETVAFAKLCQERPHPPVGHRREVLHLFDLAGLWQEIFQMASPPCGVFSLAIAAGGRPIEDRLDSLASPRGRDGLCLPDGLQDFQHESRVDLLNWQPSENWPDVFPGLVPLLQVAVASPAWPMGRDISLGTLIEGHRFRRFKLPCSSSRLASLDRINSVVVKLPGGRRPFPGLHQGYVIQRSQS